MMVSRSTEYAIGALTCVAAQPSGRVVTGHEISALTGIPLPFLWKILRHLAQKNVVRSTKGVAGGYQLARPANKISVLQVLKVSQVRPRRKGIFSDAK